MLFWDENDRIDGSLDCLRMAPSSLFTLLIWFQCYVLYRNECDIGLEQGFFLLLERIEVNFARALNLGKYSPKNTSPNRRIREISIQKVESLQRKLGLEQTRVALEALDWKERRNIECNRNRNRKTAPRLPTCRRRPSSTPLPSNLPKDIFSS